MSADTDTQRSEEVIGIADERSSLQWARRKIEEVKARLRGDPGRAYSVEFTAAAEIPREHDPVEFNSLRRLLKDKLVRLGEFDRLIHRRQGERAEDARRAKRIVKARAARAATTRTPRVADDGVQVGRYLANRQGLFLLKFGGQGAQPLKLPLANFTARITAEIRRDHGVESTREFEIEARLDGQTRRLVVAAARFTSLKWVTEQLGARAVMAAGMGIKDQRGDSVVLRRRRSSSARFTATPAGANSMVGGPICMAAVRLVQVTRSPGSRPLCPQLGTVYPAGATDWCGVEKRHAR
jgi:hypothetical protein